MQKLYLLDAYALIFRGYYALMRSPITDSKGNNNSAIFGFVNTLIDVLRRAEPDYVAVAFDPPGGTFRHALYPDYKAQREATPEDIKRAVPVIKTLLSAFGIKQFEVAGYEADDVIGTLARKGEAEGLEVHMVTPDKDYAQLVTPRVLIERPGTGGFERLGPPEVCEKYEIARPSQMIDYLALLGDAADNVPGCPGVGKKTAAKLLAEFADVEALIAAAPEMKGKVAANVTANAENILFSKRLVTICTDVPVALELDALRRREPDEAALRALFAELEFRRLTERLFGSPRPEKQKEVIFQPSLFDAVSSEEADAPKESTHERLEDVPHDYQLIDNDRAAEELCELLLTFGCVAFDTETTSVDALRAEVVGFSFATGGGRAWYVAVPRETTAARRRLEIFRPFFENRSIVKVAQNAKYDLAVLGNYGLHVAPPLFDTLLAHYLVQPELHHNLDYLAEAYLNYKTIRIEELIGAKGKTQKSMADVPPAEILNYAAEDADVALKLMEPLADELKANGLERCFNEIEMPLMPVLEKMERNGVSLNLEALEETGRRFLARMQEIETEVYELAGHGFNITSPKQVGEVLFDELKLSAKAKKTKTGQYSTSEEVLEALRDKHPVVGRILDFRGLKKLLSTYVEALPKLVNPATGRIHTSFNQAVTATGRLSSSNPNLQNIPVRGDDGREIRKAFTAEPGCLFFSADYSQIELRIMAHLSGDAHLIDDFKQGRDIHAATAARIFRKPIEAVTKDERRKAKTANFGIIYGISAFGLAERMGVGRGEAKELIDNYFATYPGVRDFINKAVEQAREKGYIETLFGRRRYLPDINSRNAVVRGYAERNAVNAPIQGTAADIIKLAMIRVDKRLSEEGLKAKMILQVHDELNFSVAPEELPRLRKLVVEEMEGACNLQVPLVADCGEGENWLEAH